VYTCIKQYFFYLYFWFNCRLQTWAWSFFEPKCFWQRVEKITFRGWNYLNIL